MYRYVNMNDIQKKPLYLHLANTPSTRTPSALAQNASKTRDSFSSTANEKCTGKLQILRFHHTLVLEASPESAPAHH